MVSIVGGHQGTEDGDDNGVCNVNLRHWHENALLMSKCNFVDRVMSKGLKADASYAKIPGDASCKTVLCFRYE